jgi:MFS family permease
MLVISALGITQILAWGSSYYLLTILAKPIAAATGWPFAWVISGLSMGLLVSGVASPQIGRAIERRGGRPVLMVSAALLALGLLTLATSLLR